MIEFFKSTLGMVTATCGAIAAIWAIPFFRENLKKLGAFLMVFIKMPLHVLDLLGHSTETKETLRLMRAEISFTGEGTLSENTLRLMNLNDHMFSVQGRPAMNLDQDGNLIRSSYALHALLRVRDSHELMRQSWTNFLDGMYSENFLASFRRSAAMKSTFKSAIQLYDNNRKALGKWELRLYSIEPPINGRALYTGHFVPICELAQEISDEHKWAV